MDSIYHIIQENWSAFSQGLLTTLKMCLIIWSAGLLIGSFLTFLSLKNNIIRKIINGLTLIIISIPLLVILYWFHYPFQRIIDYNFDPFFTASLVLSLLNTLLIYQILYSAIINFPKQFVYSAKVCGISNWTLIKNIQGPIILRQFLPSFILLQIFMLQSTIFASNISVPELFRKAQQVNALIKQPIEIFSAMALFFIAICLPLYLLGFYLMKKYSKDYKQL